MFSHRLAELKPSPTVALDGEARSRIARGIPVINLTVGEPDFGTPDIIIEQTIRSLRSGRTRYGSPGGGLPLREKVAAKLLRENQLTYHPGEIAVGVGAKQLLFHTFFSIINPGDEVLIPAPLWGSYIAQVKASGGIPVVVPYDEGESNLSPQILATYATARTKAIVLTSPNNPTGHILHGEEAKNLGRYLETKPWWVISDEIYEYYDFDYPHRSLVQDFPGLRDRFVLVNGLSKGYAMTGFRVGTLAAPEGLTSRIRTLQGHATTCIPPFIEDAAAVALDGGRALLAPKIAEVRARRDEVLKTLSTFSQLSYPHPEGAFYVFLNLKSWLEDSPYGALNSLGFCMDLLTIHNLAIVPGEAFEAPGYARLSYAASLSTLHQALERLKHALEQGHK